MQQIADWLKRLDLSEYAERFAENGIDISVLPHLTDQDLKEMGVLLGHRRKILAAIGESSGKPSSPASVPAAGAPIAPMPAAEATARPTAPTTETAGERRYLTVMFCDLVGSTAISRNSMPRNGATSWVPISTPLPLRSPKWAATSRRSSATG
jgi:SAM domain (Sterile alpha motif)